MKLKKAFLLAIAALSVSQMFAVDIVVDTKSKGPAISKTMYGIFFEDINYAADGGLYAEMVKNRSFEFQQPLTGWQCFGGVEVKADGPFDRNPHYVRLSDTGHRSKNTIMVNEGFFGYDFHKANSYNFSLWSRVPDGGEAATLKIELADPSSDGEVQAVATAEITISGSDWKKYEVTLTSKEEVKDGRLRIFLSKKGGTTVDIEHVSLFPSETWKGHKNGMRKDLAEALYNLHPGVFRFPGGCIVEGTEYFDRYQWKNTVGEVENRPINNNRWNFEFPHRAFPDYYQSGGLGFYEYFLLSEEIGAEPLPVLNVGMICQYENPDPSAQIPADSIDSYIQDAVDLVEFANGDALTTWGRVRAEMGHPEPFNLKYLAIGNEQWGEEFVRHLERFVDVLRKRCPEIKIIGSAGPSPDGNDFDYLWKEMRRLDVDLVDEHYYRNENWFLNGATRYDKFPRKGPKVFAGEYACHGTGFKRNHANAALCEAAFMTGLERNADVVEMATYAPLFAHVKGWQWRPDMIWFDNSNCLLTASYYVQQLFSTNKGVRGIQVTMNGEAITGQQGLYACASFDLDGSVIVKVVNVNDDAKQVDLNLKGTTFGSGTLSTLRLDDSRAENTFTNGKLISPVKGDIEHSRLASGVLEDSVPAKSLVVYRFKK